MEDYKITVKGPTDNLRNIIRDLGSEYKINYVEIISEKYPEPEIDIKGECGTTTLSGDVDKDTLKEHLIAIACPVDYSEVDEDGEGE